jgi:hypothetical protein
MTHITLVKHVEGGYGLDVGSIYILPLPNDRVQCYLYPTHTTRILVRKLEQRSFSLEVLRHAPEARLPRLWVLLLCCYPLEPYPCAPLCQNHGVVVGVGVA